MEMCNYVVCAIDKHQISDLQFVEFNKSLEAHGEQREGPESLPRLG